MEKKNRNRFGIMFNDYDSMHLFAAEKLNSLPQRRIASYLAEVIYAYENGIIQKSQGVTKTQGTMEKRGRGRPRKMPVHSISDLSEPITSSHIQHNNSQHTPDNDSVRVESEERTYKDENNLKKADNDMIKSMMGFVGMS